MKVLGLDEFTIHKGHGHYRLVISAPELGIVLDVFVNSRGMRATRSRAYGARESVENTWFLQLLEIDLGSPETAIRVPVSAQFERCFMVI